MTTACIPGTRQGWIRSLLRWVRGSQASLWLGAGAVSVMMDILNQYATANGISAMSPTGCSKDLAALQVPRMRRTGRLVVRDRAAALAAIIRLQPTTLVVDVQPFVAPWDCSFGTAISGAVALSEYLTDTMPDLRTLVFVTNARLDSRQEIHEGQPQVTFVTAARKPWRITYLADAPRPIVVLGDQIMTDGLLAFRLQAQFLHWRPRGRMPWWPRLQAILGVLIVRLVFTPIRRCTFKRGASGDC